MSVAEQLIKVAHDVGKASYIEGVRGRTGGIRLDMPADRIDAGEAVRHTEKGFDLIERGSCATAPACELTASCTRALPAFMAVLYRYTLADLLKRRMLMHLVEVG